MPRGGTELLPPAVLPPARRGHMEHRYVPVMHVEPEVFAKCWKRRVVCEDRRRKLLLKSQEPGSTNREAHSEPGDPAGALAESAGGAAILAGMSQDPGLHAAMGLSGQRFEARRTLGVDQQHRVVTAPMPKTTGRGAVPGRGDSAGWQSQREWRTTYADFAECPTGLRECPHGEDGIPSQNPRWPRGYGTTPGRPLLPRQPPASARKPEEARPADFVDGKDAPGGRLDSSRRRSARRTKEGRVSSLQEDSVGKHSAARHPYPPAPAPDIRAWSARARPKSADRSRPAPLPSRRIGGMRLRQVNSRSPSLTLPDWRVEIAEEEARRMGRAPPTHE